MKKGWLNVFYSPQKKSQITVFVIISVILVISIGSLVYIAKNKNNGLSNIPGFAISADRAADNIKFERDSCIKKFAVEGFDLYGLNENSVTGYISSKLEDCINPVLESYRRQFTVESNLESIDVSINAAEISVKVNFPITVKKAEAVAKIENYSLVFQRTLTRAIEHNAECIVTRDAGLMSFDGKFEIFIQEGVKATKEDGTCLENISIRLEDPASDYGKREGSLTSIDYIPMPLGAKFSEGITLKLKYTQKDYLDYINAIISDKSFLILEKDLHIQFFDKQNNNFYVYPYTDPLQNSADLINKQIKAKVNQFYGSKLSLDNNCAADRDSILESADRRVQLMISSGTTATKSDGSCVDKIIIQMAPKTSKVVNFGYFDYELLPNDATFSPYINYVYKYSAAEINNPVFLYGYKNWENLINDTWVSPLNDTRPVIELTSPENNMRYDSNYIDFKFRAVDDHSAKLNCSVFINGISKENILARNNETAIVSAQLGEGLYYWFVQCSDDYGTSTSESRNLAVGKTNTIGFTGFIIKNFFVGIGKTITGKATSGNDEIPHRMPSNLRIAYFDKEDGIYVAWPTTVDAKNQIIAARVGHFSLDIPAQGCSDVKYAGFPNVNVIPLISDNCTGETQAGTDVAYTIVHGHACTEDKKMFISLLEKISSGDTGKLIKDGGTLGGTGVNSGGHVFRVDPLTDADSSITDRSTCAYADVYLEIRGIGVTSASGKEIPKDYPGLVDLCGGKMDTRFCRFYNGVEDSSGEDCVEGAPEVNCGNDGGSGGSYESVTSGEASSGVLGGGNWANSGGKVYGPENSQYKAVFDHQEASATLKVDGMLNTSMGLFVSACYRGGAPSPGQNCKLMLNWRTIFEGGQESIGQGFDVGNGKVIFPSEEPGGGVVYSNGAAKATVNLRHSSAAAIYRGAPVFISSEEDGEFVLNAETREKIKQLAVSPKVGIPWDPAKIPGTGELFVPLVDDDGKETIVTTTDVVMGMNEATAVAAWKDKALASAKGIIYVLDFNARTAAKYLDTGSEKVNSMWYDSANDLLWVSCSSHDKLFYIDNRSNIYNVIELTDDPSSGGSLFDTRVTAGWWARTKSSQGQYYRIEKK